jgi:hypothetical protein
MPETTGPPRHDDPATKEQRPMTIAEANTYARSLPAYDKTPGAIAGATSLINTMSKTMGFPQA